MLVAASGSGRPRCLYCGVAVSRKVGQPGSPPKVMGGERTWPFTQDHIVPRAHGGCNDRRNLAPACGPCNGARGNMELLEFLRRLPDLLPGRQAVLSVEDAQRRLADAITACEASRVHFGRK